jgi:hypothetical protein
MNRFRTKKKTKEGVDGLPRPSVDSDLPPMPSPMKHSMTFRRGKKSQEPEPKLEIDLATALPSSDDFRTSLLMSGLSARFSMLREQDDPKSKIGKASDDSVLFPKRQSRLNDFGFAAHGLSDIAEVSSINGSIRPPFAFSRTDSFHEGSDADSISGSIMNRAKPGESNNLFGGRQKISMGNRTLYDNDVSMSAFQKLREKEREQREQERQTQDEVEFASRPSSPPLSGYNQNRETSSTTSSGGPSLTRTSTAATSFTSRTPSLSGSHTPITPNIPSATGGPDRSLAKTRRLYETGLDNHLHEQQFSAIHRIDSLTRQRALGGHTPPAGLSPTFANNPPSDRWDRHQVLGKQSMPNLRAASPPPTGPTIGAFDFGVKPTSNLDSKTYGMASPPLSPPMSEYDEHATLPVQPSDRGKVTATGAFTKPAPYDDNKYQQRQLQLQQGRETPPLRKPSPPRAFVPRSQVPPSMNRNRAESNTGFTSEASRSHSAVQLSTLVAQERTESPRNKIVVPNPQPMAAGTFLISPDRTSILIPSDTVQEPKQRTHPKPLDLSNMYRADQRIKLERPPESQHPAMRQRPFSPDPAGPSSRATPKAVADIVTVQPPAENAQEPPIDSPTLGPTVGLSEILKRLRSDSNSSSNYAGDELAYNSPSRFPVEQPEVTPETSYATQNNSWENDDWDQSYYGETSQDDIPPVARGTVQPPSLSARPLNVDNSGQDSRKTSWERELEIHHVREGSSETAKERMDFKEELAERRRRVQENLKSFAETERSVSPLPGAEHPKDGQPTKGNPLDLLKSKPSRGSLVVRPKEPPQSKAMKMLGLGNATISSSPSPGKASFDDNPWKQEEEEMLRGVVMPTTPPQTRAFRQARRDAQRDRERQVAMRHQQRPGPTSREPEWQGQNKDTQPRPSQEQRNDRFPSNRQPRQRTPSRERRPPPITYVQRGSQESSATSRSGSRPESRVSRDRSESETSGPRSKSRNGRYKDDLAEAMAKGTSSSHSHYEDLDVPNQRPMARSPGVAQFQQSPVPSPRMSQGVRSRSNSKSTPAGYFDPQKLQNLQIGGEGFEIGAPPRPSPTAPFVVNATPALVQPSPVGSGANTPVGSGPQGATFTAPRKRSINKAEISEPRFLSSTSTMTTVDLPPGASLRNGIEHNAPPIPPVNPRRRQTRTMFGLGRKEDLEDLHSLPAATQSSEEMSTFSADEGDDKPRLRQKLRKSSSEGGNLNSRARQIATAAPSPAMPGAFPVSSSPPRVDGGMF